MKLLLDANVSFRIGRIIEPHFTKVEHVENVFNDVVTDFEIWEYALNNNFIIVTNDEDFLNIMNVKGFPPKVVLLRTGNQSNKYIQNLLVTKISDLEDLNQTSLYGLLELYHH